MHKKITVVIPALNEKDTIAEVISGVRGYVDEVIIVDDASTDETAAIACKQGVVVLSHSKTEGYDRSIDDGFDLAAKNGAEIILTFDADGQHDPGDIQKIIEPLIKVEADVVVGRRPRCARITEHFFKVIAKNRVGINDPLCGLKGYRIEVYRDVGYFDRISSIGTQLMFNAKKKGYKVIQREISVKARVDNSRFGNKLKGNWKILGAIIRTIFRG